jgi:outer membrane biosynthesis protein TonB
MAKDPPSQSYGVASWRFWRNVCLIALAHVALIVGLIRWSVAARASTNAESIVWLGSAEDLAAREKEEVPSAQRESHAVEPKPPKDEPEEEKPAVTTAQSEIELPSPTPKPTPKPTSTPKLSATPTPKPKVTPKPTPKPARNATHNVAGGPAPKTVLLAKATPASLREAAAGRASPKQVLKTKPSSTKSSEKSEKSEKSLTAKTGTTSQSGSGKAGSTAKGTSADGGRSASEFGWYGHMLHDRFYSAWIQPTTSVPSGSKISTLVKLRIEKDGRVSKFEVIKPSENVVVNESVAAIAKRVTEVDAPPDGLIKGDHYDVKINFELNTEQEMAK